MVNECKNGYKKVIKLMSKHTFGCCFDRDNHLITIVPFWFGAN